MPAARTLDLIVIGAGIVGSACAREAARAGLHTAIVDAAPGSGATSAGMGHIVLMDDSSAQLALTAYSRSLWHEEAAMLPPDAAYYTPGTIWVAANLDEMSEVHAKFALYTQSGLRAKLLNAKDIAALEPSLRTGLSGGLLVPEDGVASPPAASKFFLAEARRFGVTVFLSRASTAADGEVLLVDGTTLAAPKIVLAVGTDCDLLPALPIKKRKGHLVLTDPQPGFLHHQLVELGYLKSAHEVTADSVAFNIQPRLSGQLCIGSSRQFGTESPEIEPPIVRQMLARAYEYMPALAAMQVHQTWTGFRAATPDQLPLIGPAAGLSQDSTLWLAAGFEGLGSTCAPAAAKLLLDQIVGRESAIDLTPYLPSRMQSQEPQ